MTQEQSDVVRVAVSADAPAILRCVRAAYSRYLDRMDRAPAPMLADFAALIDRGVVSVIPDADDVIGVLVMMPQDAALFIENVAVDPRAQGRGLGKLLMNHAAQHAQTLGLAQLDLYTNEVMTENLGFYAHLGFEIVDRREADGYQRVFMTKQLS
jgi:ribosomal protein S18 acetylase RimI-like enzyme